MSEEMEAVKTVETMGQVRRPDPGLLEKIRAYVQRYYEPDVCCGPEAPCTEEETAEEKLCPYVEENIREDVYEKTAGVHYKDPADAYSGVISKLQMNVLCSEMMASEEMVLPELDESFSEMLLRLIDERGLKNSEVYKGALVSKAVFSNIMTKSGYHTGKATVFALAVSLKLNLEETRQLLERAGYALSHSMKFDVVMEYFIKNKKYNIFEINECLLELDLPLLGERAL